MRFLRVCVCVSELLAASGTGAAEIEFDVIDLETGGLAFDAFAFGVVSADRFDGNIEDCTAHTSDGVMVGLGIWIEPRGIAQTERTGLATAGERVECVVDRSEAHRREVGPKALEEGLSRGMRELLAEEPDNRRSLRRHLEAGFAESVAHFKFARVLRLHGNGLS